MQIGKRFRTQIEGDGVIIDVVVVVVVNSGVGVGWPDKIVGVRAGPFDVVAAIFKRALCCDILPLVAIYIVLVGVGV